jgi:NADPH:quinone reductase-like Zn-dependent oxidoreductase
MPRIAQIGLKCKNAISCNESDIPSLAVRGEWLCPLMELTRLIDAGQLRLLLSTVLPLQEAREAHALIERCHTRGKIVLQVSE